MVKLRKSEERGYADHGWLKTRHSFSFADYYDPEHIGFRTLRVINEDRIQGGTGFGAHPHRDMEIISYVVQGALEHEDSTGNKAIIKPGEVQRMSAGSGVVHSEQNASADEDAHFFQIWIRPDSQGGAPSYAQKSFADSLDSGCPVLVISKDGRDGSLSIQQDADLYITRLQRGEAAQFLLQKGRGGWLQVVSGELLVEDFALEAGDGLSIEGQEVVKVQTQEASEFLFFDLA